MEIKPSPDPIIPPDRKVESWRNVLMHYTGPASILQVLELGIISKKLADRARLPYHHANIPKVQSAEGFEWISTWNSNLGKEAFRYPISSDMTIVANNQKRTSKPANLEEGFDQEWLVKNRIRAKDFVAIWINEDFYQSKIGRVVTGDTRVDVVVPWMIRIAQSDPYWKSWVLTNLRGSLQEVRKSILFEGASNKTIRQEAFDRIYPGFIREWLEKKFSFDPNAAKVCDLVDIISSQINIPFYIVTREQNQAKTIPLQEYKQLGRETSDDFVWDKYLGPHSRWSQWKKNNS